jgi:hypothetical protein
MKQIKLDDGRIFKIWNTEEQSKDLEEHVPKYIRNKEIDKIYEMNDTFDYEEAKRKDLEARIDYTLHPENYVWTVKYGLVKKDLL